MTKNNFQYIVENPKITELLDVDNSKYISHIEAIGNDYEKIIQLRMELKTRIKNNNPIYRCADCGASVYLISQKTKRRFFFRHTLEDGRCHATTRGELSQKEINAIKYNGLKEGKRHIFLKRLIKLSLEADSNFSQIEVEKRLTGNLTKEWRRPDVSAMYKDIPVVFEIQLSTTYLDVIAERRDFYSKEGILLIWVFDEFCDNDRKLMLDDIFFNNNRNAFCISNKTLDTSIQNKALYLECIWDSLSSENGWFQLKRGIVRFDQLAIDLPNQQIFFFDFNKKKQKAREAFEKFWISYSKDTEKSSIHDSAYDSIKTLHYLFPKNLREAPDKILNILYSAKYGEPIGWKFKKLIQVAHQVASQNKPYLKYFRSALKAYKRAEQIKNEDENGKWEQKVKEYRPILDSPEYRADDRHEKLIRFLFPEMQL